MTDVAAPNSPAHARLYAKRFYDGQVDGSLRSARILLRVLADHYRPRTVLDLGCGRGAWLVAAGEIGAEELHGRDGPWVDADSLLSASIRFTACNMEQPFDLDRRFDLAMSVEVAEHLPERCALPFVESLCRASDVVVFGAAVPGQGGTGHLNEQWPSYWIGRFESLGYECFDLFRPACWKDDQVDWWYRQNTFLFVKSDSACPLDRRSLRSASRPLMDVVHPGLPAAMLATPTLGTIAQLTRNWIRHRLQSAR